MSRSQDKFEQRVFGAADIEVRAAGDEGPTTIVGYPAVFNVVSEKIFDFYEVIESGAFTECLADDPDVRAVIEHEGGLSTIGRTRNGTLRLEEDEIGLRAVITPPDTQAGRDALTLVSGGYVDQMSFRFRVQAQAWQEEGETSPLRRLIKVDIDDGDVSLVSYPAYPQTSAEARAKGRALAEDGRGPGRESGADVVQEHYFGAEYRLRLAESEGA